MVNLPPPSLLRLTVQPQEMTREICWTDNRRRGRRWQVYYRANILPSFSSLFQSRLFYRLLIGKDCWAWQERQENVGRDMCCEARVRRTTYNLWNDERAWICYLFLPGSSTLNWWKILEMNCQEGTGSIARTPSIEGSEAVKRATVGQLSVTAPLISLHSSGDRLSSRRIHLALTSAPIDYISSCS